MTNEIKIIQREPAWELHAYIRYLNLSYSCDDSPTNTALGLSSLPILVVVSNDINSGNV